MISIPPPGVPTPTFDVSNDIAFASISDSDFRFTKISSENNYNDSNLDNTTTNSNDWTEPFVTDQEEEKRRK